MTDTPICADQSQGRDSMKRLFPVTAAIVALFAARAVF
jgi:hypothetical protein